MTCYVCLPRLPCQQLRHVVLHHHLTALLEHQHFIEPMYGQEVSAYINTCVKVLCV